MKEKIWLSEDISFISGECDEANENIIIDGGTGSGKTFSYVYPLLLHGTYETSTILTCTKRTVVRTFRELLKSRGYLVTEMDLIDPDNSTVCFDPMYRIRTPDDNKGLAFSIIMSNSRKQNSKADPWWDQAAISLLNTLIGLARKVKGEAASMNDVLGYAELSAPREYGDPELDRLVNSLEFTEEDAYIHSSWKTYTGNPDRTIACIYTTMMSALDEVFPEAVRHLMRTKQPLDITDVCRIRTALIVTTSPVARANTFYMSLFYTQVFRELLKYAASRSDGRLPVPVRIVADDFCTGAPVPDFDKYISVFRECGISCSLLIQSESQLKGLYEDSGSQTILNNCSTYVLMSTNDLSSAQTASKRLDLPLKEILESPRDRTYVFRQGRKAQISGRYRTPSDPMYKELMKELRKEEV